MYSKQIKVKIHNVKTGQKTTGSWCLKITEKVSFNVVSAVSYVFILYGKKFIKFAKNGPFWRVF